MNKLLIVSGSSRLLKEPKTPIPAIDRFDGLLIRSIRHYFGRLKNVDILILSPVYGIIPPKEKIPYQEPISGSWRKAQLSEDQIQALRKANLVTMGKYLSKKKYDEIYINAGATMRQLIEGLEQLVPKTTKIVYARGGGIGPKTAHMKDWMQQQL